MTQCRTRQHTNNESRAADIMEYRIDRSIARERNCNGRPGCRQALLCAQVVAAFSKDFGSARSLCVGTAAQVQLRDERRSRQREGHSSTYRSHAWRVKLLFLACFSVYFSEEQYCCTDTTATAATEYVCQSICSNKALEGLIKCSRRSTTLVKSLELPLPLACPVC